MALKKVRFDNLEPESVQFMAREILILRRLDHPNIIKLEGLVTSRMSCSLYLVFEYMEHDLTGLASFPDIQFTEPQVSWGFFPWLVSLSGSFRISSKDNAIPANKLSFGYVIAIPTWLYLNSIIELI